MQEEEMTTRTAQHSGWSIDEENDTMPGDHISIPVHVQKLDSDEKRPCQFCNSCTALAERGFVMADYRLAGGYAMDRTMDRFDSPDDVAPAAARAEMYACHVCIASAAKW